MNATAAPALVVLCDWRRVGAPERLLGPRERRWAAGLQGARRLEWVRTRLTAKAAVRWFTGRTPGPGGIEILSAHDGAPEVLGPAVAVSLAHTGDVSLCAVSRRGTAVGVDAERIDPRNDAVRLRVTGPGDVVPIRSGRPGAEATLLFACKEAAFKAHRAATPVLRDYRVRARRDGFGVGLDRPGGRELTLWPSLTGTLALAFCQDRPEPPCWRWAAPAQVLAALQADTGRREKSECHP
jgi:4'-phosphopantetheinyl transferase